MRAVIDTNVWVSAVLNPHGAPAQVFEAFRQARFLAIQSQPLMDELREVIARPRLMRRLAYNMQMIQELIELISASVIANRPSNRLQHGRVREDTHGSNSAMDDSVPTMLRYTEVLKIPSDSAAVKCLDSVGNLQ